MSNHLGSSSRESILCYCNLNDYGCWNETCRTVSGAACFYFKQDIYDDVAKEMVTHHEYGCLPPEEGDSAMQCHSHLSPHATPKTIRCCFNEDFCNKNITLEYNFGKDPPAFEKGTIDTNYDTFLPLIFACFGIAVVFIFAVAFCYYRYVRMKKERRAWESRIGEIGDALLGGGNKASAFCDPYASYNGSNSTSGLIDQSSGSGSGMPVLVQRTIARQCQLEKMVGKGRFGEVHMARWHGDLVAVKLFQTTDEASWKREKEIYQTVMLRHENILCFIGADIGGTGGTTYMYLVTAYHELGSLHDYLKSHTVDYEVACRLAFTAASGLAHLHVEILGTEGKPGIAHRDIKSKNILVKNGEVCIIADFGLAVRHTSKRGELDIQPNPRQGTIRYMAPEVLNKTINEHEFEAYKRADMYAFGLVLWEIATRCHGKGTLQPCSYKVPYEGLVPPDPGFDAMRNLVCANGDREGCRPPINKYWLGDVVLTEFAVRMEECWHGNPNNRLTALNVKKKLADLKKLSETIMRIAVTPSPPPTLQEIV